MKRRVLSHHGLGTLTPRQNIGHHKGERRPPPRIADRIPSFTFGRMTRPCAVRRCALRGRLRQCIAVRPSVCLCVPPIPPLRHTAACLPHRRRRRRLPPPRGTARRPTRRRSCGGAGRPSWPAWPGAEDRGHTGDPTRRGAPRRACLTRRWATGLSNFSDLQFPTFQLFWRQFSRRVSCLGQRWRARCGVSTLSLPLISPTTCSKWNLLQIHVLQVYLYFSSLSVFG